MAAEMIDTLTTDMIDTQVDEASSYKAFGISYYNASVLSFAELGLEKFK